MTRSTTDRVISGSADDDVVILVALDVVVATIKWVDDDDLIQG